MKFVLTYLPFDVWGEVTKSAMSELFDDSLHFEGRTIEMLKRIVWNLLERSKLVENNALRKRNLEIWFEPVKVVYLLLLSIMFGSEYKTMGDMLSDLMRY